MDNHLLITQTSMEEVKKAVAASVVEQLKPLAEEVQRLREQMNSSRRVVTYKEAPAFFDYEVKPERIVEYINFRGLPAFKNGRKWFIYLEDLQDWQIGKIGYPENRDEPCVVPPRHSPKKAPWSPFADENGVIRLV